MRNPRKPGVKLTQSRSGPLEEIHLWASPQSGETDAQSQTRSLYRSLLEQLEDPSSLRIVAERAFGRLSAKEEFLSARGEVLSKAGFAADNPVTYLEGAPLGKEAIAGVQMTLLGTKDVKISPLYDGKRLAGFCVGSGPIRRAYLSAMDGLDLGKRVPSREDQARRMFQRTRRLLGQADMTYRDVLCTRIYIRSILSWYSEFNSVRNRFYRKAGILKEDGESRVPSSTGIQGKASEECECVMDVLAVSVEGQEGCPFETLHNPLQSEATSYGSSFARGVTLEAPGVRYVIISGTASIDEKGRTVHAGDAAGQTQRTMDNFETILKVAGATPQDLYEAVWYARDTSCGRDIRAEMRRRNWPELPYLFVTADICRDDLLVEIDGAAILRRG